MTRSAGIDVGGTKLLGVVLDAEGAVIAEQRRPTPRGGAAVLQAVADLARVLAPFDTLGVGVPGLVTRDGVLRAAPNLGGVTELAVGPPLRRELGCRVEVDNDATCALVAEWRCGAARGLDHAVLVTMGTGIGGGLVLGGELQRGANGFAGEFGHMTVDPDGPACPCGRRGCWERYASGSGLRDLAGGRRGEDVVAAARAGDPSSREILDRFAGWVALGLVNLTNALDPQAFVLGGGLAAAADVLTEPIRMAFGERLYSPEHRSHPDICFATLGERAGAIGAALLPSVHVD